MTSGASIADLLVLEPAERGHGHEWLMHLAASARRRRLGARLVFAVPPGLAERLRRELPQYPDHQPIVLPITPREVELCNHRRLAVSGLARWWVMRRLLKVSGIRRGLFLELDHLTLPLALGLPVGSGRSVSGILFRPSVHYDREPGLRLGERLRDWRKDLLYRLMLRRGAVHRVHTLDDAFPAFARGRYRSGDKVVELPDPVFPLVDATDADRELASRAPADRVVLVLFGVLTARKGILALLQALAQVDSPASERLAVFVAGRVDPAIRETVHAACAALADARPSLWFHLEDRHLGSGEIAGLVDRSDAVLAPYQRFVGSSGVLMWAAGRGRPVIAQDYGLVGRLVREHGLGTTVDTTDAAALAGAISAVATHGAAGIAKPERLSGFAVRRTPEAFAAGILDPLERRSEAPRTLENRHPEPVTE